MDGHMLVPASSTTSYMSHELRASSPKTTVFDRKLATQNVQKSTFPYLPVSLQFSHVYNFPYSKKWEGDYK